jgi:hypothetical protein
VRWRLAQEKARITEPRTQVFESRRPSLELEVCSVERSLHVGTYVREEWVAVQ